MRSARGQPSPGKAVFYFLSPESLDADLTVESSCEQTGFASRFRSRTGHLCWPALPMVLRNHSLVPLDPDRLLTLIRHHHPRINQGIHHWQAGQLFCAKGVRPRLQQAVVARTNKSSRLHKACLQQSPDPGLRATVGGDKLVCHMLASKTHETHVS